MNIAEIKYGYQFHAVFSYWRECTKLAQDGDHIDIWFAPSAADLASVFHRVVNREFWKVVKTGYADRSTNLHLSPVAWFDQRMDIKPQFPGKPASKPTKGVQA